MESHPEENHNCEHKEEGDEPVLGLLGSKLLYGSGTLLSLLGGDISVLEPPAAAEVDGNRKDKGYSGNCKTQSVGT